jgi:hypothetical protein
MNFSEALLQALNGRSIRISNWDTQVYWKWCHHYSIFTDQLNRTVQSIPTYLLVKDNWEVC